MLVHCAAPPHTQRCDWRRGRTDGADSRRPPSEPDLDGLAGRQLEVARDAERNGLPGTVRRALDPSQLRAVAAGQHRAPEALVPEEEVLGPRRSVVFAVQQDARSVRFDAGLRWQRRRRRRPARECSRRDREPALRATTTQAGARSPTPPRAGARGSAYASFSSPAPHAAGRRASTARRAATSLGPAVAARASAAAPLRRAAHPR